MQYGVDISGMPGLWPGGKDLGRKKHRPGWPSSRRHRPASAENGGLYGDPPGRPYRESTQRLDYSAVPARAMKWKPPHGFCAQGPCPRAWHPVEGHL